MRMSGLNVVLQALLVPLFSCATLLFSAFAFVPHWKGSKGMNWIFYINDGSAALMMFPIYVGGAVAFGHALLHPAKAVKSPLAVSAIACSAAISFLYTFYVVVMRFAGPDAQWLLFVIVPGSAAVAYTLMAIALVRRFESPEKKSAWTKTYAWLVGFLGMGMAKVPLAMSAYQRLPDQPPESCFIVTAATRGHPSLVGTSYDQTLNREMNEQLRRFWELEERLKQTTPRIHQYLRRIYNRVGPRVASLIVTRWQADMVYILLKPLEWGALAIVRATN